MDRSSLLERLQAEERVLLNDLEQCRSNIEALSGIQASEPNAVVLREFLGERLTDFEWLFGGAIAAGTIGMLVADPTVGKTTLLVQAALCLTHGRSPFGYRGNSEIWRVTRPVPSLYVLAEGSRAAFQNRVRTAAAAIGVPDTVPFWLPHRNVTDYLITSPAFESMIRTSGAGLVVLDTLGYFHKGNENDATDWKKHVMAPLRSMTAKYGCSFILVHHQVKATPERTGWQKGRGTSAMFGDLDFYLRLENVESDSTGNQRVLYMDKNKYSVTEHISLTFVPAEARFL